MLCRPHYLLRFITLAAFFSGSCAHAVERWVATTGDDGAVGTQIAPLRTINACAQLAEAGDSCIIRAGVYRETVRPLRSGTPTALIRFKAYADERVVVSGADPVVGWTAHQGSIYKATISLPISGHADTGFLANQVFVNGEMMIEARWPNMSTQVGRESDLMRPVYAGGGVSSPTDLNAVVSNGDIPLISEPWAGATVWTSEWYTARTGTITGGSGTSLNATMTAVWQRGGFWFYLSNKLALLDAPREWFYGSGQLYLWAPSGVSPQNVEAKQRNFAFDLTDRSHVEIRDLSFFAATVTTSDSSAGVVIDNVTAKYLSHHATLPEPPVSEWSGYAASRGDLWLAAHAHDTGIQLRGTAHTLKNSRLTWSSGNGVLLKGSGHTIRNNVIENTNYMVSNAAAIRINGGNHLIQYNSINRTARDALIVDWHTTSYDFPNSEIAYNDIANFGMLSTDLGAIYLCCYINMAGTTIHHNHVHDGYGFSPFWGTRGIYFDIESFNSTVHHNVTWNLMFASDGASFLGGSQRGYHRIYSNTFATQMFVDAGLEARNNIFRGDASIATTNASNNLFSATDPLYADAANANFSLASNSPAIDAGVVVPSITENFVGGAPDIGAYERGAPRWKPGGVDVNALATQCPFDIDRSGSASAASDGIILLRYALGYFESTLAHPASDVAASSAVIRDSLSRDLPRLDIDGNGSVDVNDAIIVVRHLRGMSGAALTNGVALSGSRSTNALVSQYLASGCPAP